MEQEKAEKITTEFFKGRFPDKDLKFEKECGYFWEWVNRFKSGNPEPFMDGESKTVWGKMQLKEKLKQLLEDASDLSPGYVREVFDEVMGF